MYILEVRDMKEERLMENIKEQSKSNKSNKIIPEVTVTFKNEPNIDLIARAFIAFHHKTKHYL